MPAADDFNTKIENVLIGRSTRGMSVSHAAHRSKHAQYLIDCDTHWAAMTQGEKDSWITTFNDLSKSDVKSRINIGVGIGFPKKIFITPDMIADLKTRYT